MKMIALTQGMVALVDDADFESLNRWKWNASLHSGFWYAKRNVDKLAVRGTVFMHRVITGAMKGQVVDHADHNTLNNQRENLRVGTKAMNNVNRLFTGNASGFRGVSWANREQKWIAQVSSRYVGRFSNPQDAARAYDKAAEARWGEFAMTNKKLGLLPPYA